MLKVVLAGCWSLKTLLIASYPELHVWFLLNSILLLSSSFHAFTSHSLLTVFLDFPKDIHPEDGNCSLAKTLEILQLFTQFIPESLSYAFITLLLNKSVILGLIL